ncbi:LytTR family DNA-binding domain-containing protein [Flavobacterium sp. SUN046]|uniref:LytR/AlgR family response regulator transcription factor n=1 Tax=Flavobacterium sp. SUN046 TaxID=3002440 RepID=UPI002DB6D066|nr:LytTR family DNA-binding domain-containing protein [Flavobacterium sp. SUN046]MEC4049025.1 LytTR family DNA-binding domain-containing protein [Flavobacterium sp. SUN046]
MKIVLIEDEHLTAKDLAMTIKEIEPDFEIVEILTSVEEAIAYLSVNNTIDLIFSDIQLGDGLSFEIFEKTNNKIPVIFCTAYDEYALKAFNTFGIYYFLKPFTKETVTIALSKYHDLKEKLQLAEENNFTEIIKQLKTNLNPNISPSIIIYEGDKIIPINSSNIAFFYIDHKSTYAQTFDNKRHLISQNMEYLERSLGPLFFRANRQYLLNRKAVIDASQFFNRKIVVNLNVICDEKVIVGKLKVSSFLEWLTNF